MRNKYCYYTLAIFLITFLSALRFEENFPSPASYLVVPIGLLVFSLTIGILLGIGHEAISWIAEDVIQEFAAAYIKSRQIRRRLMRIVLSEQEEENIVGDLYEEFIEIRSKSEFGAYMWLCRQVFKSVLPLIYKTAKSRVASYFGERVR